MDGFLLIDKESSMTSFDVVRQVRRLAGERKVGHSGTLDPLATGLLVLALGEGTKLLEFFIGCDKEYEVLAEFGKVSDSFDADGQIAFGDLSLEFNQGEIERVIERNFLGEIDQIPPKFSALKIAGRRAYEMARAGEEVEMKVRKVRISAFEILEFNWPFVRFRVKCGSGTYIRSLVNDLGAELGCGAYVKELRRTVLGDFKVEDGYKLDDLSNKIEQKVVDLSEAGRSFPLWELSYGDFAGLSDGKVLLGKKIEHQEFVMAYYKDELVGVLENHDGGVKFRKRIFPRG